MFSDVSLISMAAAIVRALLTRKSSHRKSSGDPLPAPAAGRPRGMSTVDRNELIMWTCRAGRVRGVCYNVRTRCHIRLYIRSFTPRGEGALRPSRRVGLFETYPRELLGCLTPGVVCERFVYNTFQTLCTKRHAIE